MVARNPTAEDLADAAANLHWAAAIAGLIETGEYSGEQIRAAVLEEIAPALRASLRSLQGGST